MSRIPPVPASALDDRTRAIFDAVKSRFGALLEPVAAMAHSPALLEAYVAFETRFAPAAALPARLRELANLKAATLVGCAFCIDIGSAEGAHAGIDASALRDLPRFEESPHFDAAEKAALAYCVAMTRDAGPDEALFERLRRHLSDAQIVELTAVVAWENFRARFNHALGFAPHGFAKRGACALPEPAAPSAQPPV